MTAMLLLFVFMVTTRLVNFVPPPDLVIIGALFGVNRESLPVTSPRGSAKCSTLIIGNPTPSGDTFDQLCADAREVSLDAHHSYIISGLPFFFRAFYLALFSF